MGRPNDDSGDGMRLTLSVEEAAAALGVSRDYFDKHVIHELRVIRVGRRILVPTNELGRWVELSAARLLDA
jgi:excisionase family DNA binding protein